MVDGKTDSHAGCNISGVSDFLKIRPNGNREIKEDLVENIEDGDHPFQIGQRVSDKNDDQAGVFQGQDLALTKAYDAFSDQRAQVIVDQIVDHKQDGHLLNRILEFLHHQQNRKSDKNAN